MIIKQLQQAGENFAPRTVAEAVLVHHEGKVKRLDLVLIRKIESVSGSNEGDLNITLEGPLVVIVHAKKTTPVVELTPLKITHDAFGHITSSEPVKSFKVTLVNGGEHINYTGAEEQNLHLGDDFEQNNKIIGLHWNNF